MLQKGKECQHPGMQLKGQKWWKLKRVRLILWPWLELLDGSGVQSEWEFRDKAVFSVVISNETRSYLKTHREESRRSLMANDLILHFIFQAREPLYRREAIARDPAKSKSLTVTWRPNAKALGLKVPTVLTQRVHG
jgi:hypothetical protein